MTAATSASWSAEAWPAFQNQFFNWEHFKASVRAKVEHSIGVVKRVFGFSKVRYRGLDKNANRVFVACALANLFMVRKRLLRVAPG